jgi:hypothetical protein
MSNKLFDDLAKGAATATTRRDALRIVISGLIGVLLSMFGGRGARAGNGECPQCGECLSVSVFSGAGESKIGNCDEPCTTALACGLAIQDNDYTTLKQALNQLGFVPAADPRSMIFNLDGETLRTVLETPHGHPTFADRTGSLFYLVEATGETIAFAAVFQGDDPSYALVIDDHGGVVKVLPRPDDGPQILTSTRIDPLSTRTLTRQRPTRTPSRQRSTRTRPRKGDKSQVTKNQHVITQSSFELDSCNKIFTALCTLGVAFGCPRVAAFLSGACVEGGLPGVAVCFLGIQVACKNAIALAGVAAGCGIGASLGCNCIPCWIKSKTCCVLGEYSCVDTDHDVNNCGGCREKCDPGGPPCKNGKCMYCDGEQSLCKHSDTPSSNACCCAKGEGCYFWNGNPPPGVSDNSAACCTFDDKKGYSCSCVSTG